MLTIDRLAQLIVSSWKLGNDDSRIPTSCGILDRALRIATEHEAFPDWVRKELHFVDSRIGLQCIELPSILEWAQRAQLTAAPNPSYQYTDVQVSSKVAKRLIAGLGESPSDAEKWGKLLQDAIASAEDEVKGYSSCQLEAY
ncbi:hypothetical protein DSCO28_72460 (plasmid) [Desulfosarcina ovata subsp. sediminis]|uniref:Uncharacterized protein n=1 Tax=Desulfosarcina ovata subsp. sediminis TaxID=885957 RepID=A0A5K8A2Y9_9BACT|nr:hypothetical protein [Desulfosarcina ovata]BBO86680.1 hypothetical protein DSCO28_72460 [Desulfosarcina ovata subsp. sediminis]